MDLEILVLGDGAFVHAVLNGVSMVDGYGTLGAIGALLGLLLMGVKGIMNPGGPKFDPSQLLISFVIFWVMFVPRVDKVIVTEVMVQPGNMAPRSRVVDNVPFGLAAAGYLISNIGVKLTGLYETVLGRPEDEARGTTGGLGENLMLLAAMRSMVNNPHFTDPPPPGEGKEGGFLENYRANMTTYMAKCAIGLMNNGQMTRHSIINKPNVTGLLNDVTANPLTHVRLKLNGPEEANGSVFKSCREARVILEDHSKSPKLAEAFDRATEAAGSTVTSKDILGAFGGYVGQESLTAQLMVATHMINAIQSEAQIRGSLNAMEAQAIIMTEEAAARRNVQWAAEESMFIRILRPIVGFFEGLVYALGPIMAFVVGLGPFGWGLVGKYLMLTVWVSLWFPMLAISQLYSKIQMENFFERLGSSTDYTPHELTQISNQAMDTLGATSALVAATPALAMSLLYGGAVSMSYLASRLQASDMIDENKMAPNASQIAPLHGQQSATSGTLGEGTTVTGGVDPVMQLGSSVSAGATMAKTGAETRMRQFSEGLSNIMTKTDGTMLSGANLAESAEMRTFTDKVGESLKLNSGRDVASKEAYDQWTSMSDSQKAATSSKWYLDNSASATVGYSAGVPGVGPKAEASISTRGGHMTAKDATSSTGIDAGSKGSMGVDTAVKDSMARDKNLAAEGAVAIASAVRNTVTTTGSSGFSQADASALLNTASEGYSYQTSYSTMQGHQSQAGTTESLTQAQVSQNFINGGEAERRVSAYEQQFDDLGMGTKLSELRDGVQANSRLADPLQQRIAAVGLMLQNHNGFEDQHQDERIAMLGQFVSDVTVTGSQYAGSDILSGGGVSQAGAQVSANVDSHVPGAGTTSANVAPHATGSGMYQGQAAGSAGQIIGDAQSAAATGRATVDGRTSGVGVSGVPVGASVDEAMPAFDAEFTASAEQTIARNAPGAAAQPAAEPDRSGEIPRAPN